MSTEENKAIVRKWYEYWNSGNLDALWALHSPDIVDHNPFPGQAPGLEGMKQSLGVFRSAFPDLKITITQLVAEGDKVADHGMARGTNTGAMMGIPATGKAVEITASNIWRIANGKITDIWHVEDLLSMMQQIGVIPAPGQ